VIARRLCLVIVALLVLSSFWGSWVHPAPAGALGERLVLAFYYAWFGMDTWDLPLSDYPLYPYTSTHPAAIERHVREAQQAGIDAFVQSWYGPEVENNQTETNFVQLLEIATRHRFRVAIDVEVTSPFFHSAAGVVNALKYLLAVHAPHPAYLRVNGQPVIFFWRQGQYPVETWYNIRDQVDPNRTSIWIMEGTDLAYLGPFDGNHLYSVAWSDDPAGTLVRWSAQVRDWSAAQTVSRTWVATVMPGYDDLNTGRAGVFVRPRAGGQYYRQCWDGAIRSNADWVVITSFNEWREGTQIETSAGYGDFYLNLTAEMAARYRQGAPAVPNIAPVANLPPAGTPKSTEPTEEPVPTAPPATGTATPAPLPSPTSTATPTPLPPPMPTGTSVPTRTPTPTRTPIPTPVPTAHDTATSLPTTTPTLSERAAAWPGGGWVLGAVVALLAVGAAVQAMRLRREVLGK